MQLSRPDSRLSSHASRGVARWAPPVLFVAVAIVHLHQTLTADLNPWFGGGFAMFSTTYRPWPQALSIEADDASGKHYLSSWIPQRFGATGLFARERLLAQPDRESLTSLAEYALRSSRRGGAAPRQALAAVENAGLLERVRFRDADAGAIAKIEPLMTGPDARASSDLVLVHARARVWRLAFDGREARFTAMPIGEAGEADLAR
ncbi:MAG TPA: hypothetical protein VN634_19600 [Candidatus Limnocylindrales bacterium]|nr:hypothetical protein [Candidatus Limnocylindrales bacterium]